ncbi:MAG: EAL domain-containing protein [Pseudomonadota bacterium]|nr:EAL domain-containing protein [Pseudomonadota bacterium]
MGTLRFAQPTIYLSRFPIDRLKIDQSFVRGVEGMPVNGSIIRAIAALAKSLSLQVVAEGVETEAELAVIRECGCDESQGYLHARPLPADRFADWLREHGGAKPLLGPSQETHRKPLIP